MADAQCDGAAFGRSGGLGPGTVIMSFVDVLTCPQRPGPPVPVVGAHVLQNEHLTAAVMQTGGNSDGGGRGGSSMESTMFPANGVESYRMHPAQPLSDSCNNEEGGGSWNVSSGGLMCSVDAEEFDLGLLDSLVVPSAQFELHGPLTQLMTPPPREALAGDKDEFGWLMQSTDTTSCDPRTDSLPVNEDANRQLFYTRLQQGKRRRGQPKVAAPRPHTHADDALRQLTMHISTNDLHCCNPARLLQLAPSGGRPRLRPPATAPPRMPHLTNND
jgi:hypothetical protein